MHFHDLRHTGNTLTAAAGANLRELMARMGHSSTRAALIYLHATDERQRKIADALGELAAKELKRQRSGTQRARRRRGASLKIVTDSQNSASGLLLYGGGAKGTRTPDPLLAKQVLFQLSYSPGTR